VKHDEKEELEEPVETELPRTGISSAF